MISGSADGVTAFDGVLAAPVPTRLVAVTVKVYAVPLASPVTVTGLLAPRGRCLSPSCRDRA